MSSQELKNEMFRLREILEKKEKEVAEIKAKIADLEKQLGIATPSLAAPVPTVTPAPTMAAPTPTIETAPAAPSSVQAPRQKSILQKIPRSGTSQLHARETQYECPNCGSHYNSEIEDKSKILYVVGAGTRIYAKKHRCMNCGNEWS
ncbi:MAG: hypothetical protein EU536_03135 [Promethearchaeota archaeon]|nr:MAG: hypothetical protein EU536_03135 [Candidatus Lokiarchaeota archaeon]